MQNKKFFEILVLVLRVSVKPQRKLYEIISRKRKARVLRIFETSSWCLEKQLDPATTSDVVHGSEV